MIHTYHLKVIWDYEKICISDIIFYVFKKWEGIPHKALMLGTIRHEKKYVCIR